MIPDMTTGISDYDNRDMSVSMSNGKWKRTFITSSGLNDPKPAIPMPALLVPYADPIANSSSTHNHMVYAGDLILTAKYHLFRFK